MNGTLNTFKAGDFWRFGDDPAFGEFSEPEAFLAYGHARALEVFDREGIERPTLTSYSKATEGLDPGSTGHVAVIVIGAVWAAGAALAALSEHRSSPPPLKLISDMALAMADFGVKFAVLHSMVEGLTDEASRGRKNVSYTSSGGHLAAPTKRAKKQHKKELTLQYAKKEIELGLSGLETSWSLKELTDQVLYTWPVDPKNPKPGRTTLRGYIVELIEEGQLVLP